MKQKKRRGCGLGLIIILCAVAVSAFMAWKFPVKQDDEEEVPEDA